jgi:NAD(P)H dehydrogenase (quinone)
MKAHIVFAHPGSQSFNHEILERVQDAFRKMNIASQVRDLYKMNFNPVLSDRDLHNVERGQVSPDIDEEQSLITEADLLVMIYPVWWWSQPAILKGYIDRVFTNQFAFRYTENGLVGLLKGKQAVIFTTTRESEAEMKQDSFDQAMKTQVVDGIFSFCGFDQVIYKNFAEVPYVSDTVREQMLMEVEKIISSVRHPVMV